MANVLKIIHFTGSVKLFFPKVCYKVDFKIIKNEFIMKTFIDTINFGVKTGGFLLLGLLYILIAICLMFTPLASYVALSVLFSVSMFVSGTLEILLPSPIERIFPVGAGIWQAVSST